MIATELLADAADVRVRPLTPDGLAGRVFTVDLEQGQADERTLRLFLGAPQTLAQHDELHLPVATFGSSVAIGTATLEIAGSDCRFAAAPGTRLRNNETLTLLRGQGCSRLAAATGELRLTIRLRAPRRVAVLAIMPASSVDPSTSIYLGAQSPSPGEARPLLRGSYVERLPETGLRRVDLLVYVWQLAWPGWWIWTALAAAGLLLAGGTWILLAPGGHAPGHFGTSALLGAGGFLLAAGLGMGYAVLVPPFQAADEPNHFAAFGAAIRKPDFDLEAARWAQLGHFERIQFRTRERFRPSDLGSPGLIWDDGTVPDATMRGAGVEWLWSALGPLVREAELPRLLLGLRLGNVAWFAFCIGLLCFAMGRFGGLTAPELLVLPLLWIPALPFFGMHVSNHAVLLGTYLIAGAGTLLLALDSRHAHAAGPLIGVGWAAGLLVSRAAAPMAPFILLLLEGRLLLGARERRLSAALTFWLGIGIPISIALYLGPLDYLDAFVARAAGVLPWPFSAAAAGLRAHAWLVVPIAVLFALLEDAIARLRSRAGWRPPSMWVRIAASVGAAGVLVLSAGALFVQYPVLTPIPAGTTLEPRKYVAEVLAAGLTLFRFGPPDWLTSYTFWGGFGWLDTWPPEGLVVALAGASGVALAGLLAWIGWTANLRAGLWLAVVLLGFTATLATYALVVATLTPADIHGRYLLGLYTWLLLVCWSSLARAVDSQAHRVEPSLIALLCIALAAAVHAVSLVAVVQRYF